MHRWAIKLKFLAILIIMVAAPVLNFSRPVQAAGSCVSSISPDTVEAGSFTSFTVTVSNTRPAAIQWVDINVPADFNYGGNSVNGWTSTDHNGGSTFTGSTITSGQSFDFTVSAQAGLTTGPAAWTIQASGDPSGAGPSTCAGQSSVTVNPSTSNQILNIAVTDITDSSATISWDTTNPASSIVYYGTTSGYGNATGEDPALTTSHTVPLSSLSPSQNYHFQVSGSDTNGNPTSSADNTFVTGAAPPPSDNGGGGNNGGGGGNNGGGGGGNGGPSPTTNTTTTTGPKKTTPKNSKKANIVPPEITLNTKLSGAYKTAPIISGVASDNEQVAKVEFSTDGGANWLPADSVTGLGTKSAAFSTALPLSQDGNYSLVVRAVDNDGATAVSASQILVIDQLPPLISALSSSIGSQPIDPDRNGIIKAVENMDQRIVAGAQGGPISITVTAVNQDNKQTSYNFALTQSKDDGLWQGIISFHAPGLYRMSVRAIDGADNVTQRNLGQVMVAASGRVLGKDSKPVSGAKVKVFFKDQETNTWVEWDGAAYDQASQLSSNSKGGYSLFLPYGTYYLQTRAKGYTTLTTRSFNVSSPTVISSDLHLTADHSLSIAGHRLGLPWYHGAKSITVAQTPKNITKQASGPKSVPNFKLTQTNGRQISTADLLGKPTVVTFLTTWSLASQEQLPLVNANSGSNFNWIVIGSGESLSRWTTYVKIAGYDTPVSVDSSNQIAQLFGLGAVPSHYFFDRHGNLYDTKVGILSAKEVINNLRN